MANSDNARESMYDNAFMKEDRERDQQRYKFNQAITGLDLNGTTLDGVDPNMLNRAAFARVLQAVANEKQDRLPDSAFMNTRGDSVIFQHRDGRAADDPAVPRFSVLASDLADDARRLGIQSPFEAAQYQAQLDNLQRQLAEREQQRMQDIAARANERDNRNPCIGALS